MAGSVRGSVLTAALRAAVGASVVIAEGPGPMPDIAAVCDDAGRFALDGIAAGAYLLRAFGEDGAVGTASVRVQDYGMVDARIVLDDDGVATAYSG